jgi:hypothetical protein
MDGEAFETIADVIVGAIVSADAPPPKIPKSFTPGLLYTNADVFLKGKPDNPLLVTPADVTKLIAPVPMLTTRQLNPSARLLGMVTLIGTVVFASTTFPLSEP